MDKIELVDQETAEYVYRFLYPSSDGDICHPDVYKIATIICKIRKRYGYEQRSNYGR